MYLFETRNITVAQSARRSCIAPQLSFMNRLHPLPLCCIEYARARAPKEKNMFITWASNGPTPCMCLALNSESFNCSFDFLPRRCAKWWCDRFLKTIDHFLLTIRTRIAACPIQDSFRSELLSETQSSSNNLRVINSLITPIFFAAHRCTELRSRRYRCMEAPNTKMQKDDSLNPLSFRNSLKI